jgi:hypothetical protein
MTIIKFGKIKKITKIVPEDSNKPFNSSHPLDEVLKSYHELIQEGIIGTDFPRYNTVLKQRLMYSKKAYESWLFRKYSVKPKIKVKVNKWTKARLAMKEKVALSKSKTTE